MDIQASKTSKYKLEELGSDTEEYKFVKNFFDTTKSPYRAKRRSTADFKMFKILENNPITKSSEKRSNFMLFHGTNQKGVEGILKEGFKNSKIGWFGQGVYMTDCSCVAQGYCLDDDFKTHVFVNEVFDSEKLKTKPQKKKLHNVYGACDQDTMPEHPFEKHVYDDSQQPSEEDYKEDSVGRKYRNVAHDSKSIYDEYLADETITIPRYLFIRKLQILPEEKYLLKSKYCILD